MPKYISISDAARLLPKVSRILVIGCSGGGKTTLAVDLATRLGIEYQSLDRDVRWLPGWNEREKLKQRNIIKELVTRSSWVMDGSGASTFDIRLPRADLVLWVRVKRHIALKGLAERVICNIGTVRPYMARGCPEQLPDFEFLAYIWNFEKRQTPKFKKNLTEHGANVPVAMLKSHFEIQNLLQGAFETNRPR